MPAYNAEEYIAEAIESILLQTYPFFEFIIINDGSTDKTKKIIKSFSDKRIRYIENKKNQGLSTSLNTGLKEAKGMYIARMDADDISEKDRLQKQVAFLKSHPNYGVVGSMYIVLDQRRKIYEIGGMDFRFDDEMKLSLLSNNVFVHGETMFRKKIIDDYSFSYNKDYNPCEDYELWVRMSRVTKFAILEDILYLYMINTNSMSGTRWTEMKDMIKKIAKEKQEKDGLPKFSIQTLFTFFKQGRKKRDGVVVWNNQEVPQFHQLNYQEFLFRTGLVYCKHLNPYGLFFLFISFAINPFNWGRKFYRILFLTHPRLQNKLQ
jgi:glycosyltransferase involved in cell wall biosynthesis